MESIGDLEERLEISLPADFKRFHNDYGGGEGSVGGSYLVVWPISDIEELNEVYEVEEYAPDILLFGSNGAGEGIGFDMRFDDYPVVVVPFIGMSLDAVVGVSANFDSFISKLANGGSLF